MPDLDSPILCPLWGGRSAKEWGAQARRAPLSLSPGKKPPCRALCGKKGGQKIIQLALERVDWLVVAGAGTSSLRVTTTSKVLSVPDCWDR